MNTSRQFVHLQTHSEYSMLLGAIHIKPLISKVKKMGQSAIALTDHGNMFGTLEFYNQAKKEGIKSILGCDFYLAPDSRKNSQYSTGEPWRFKITLLAENQQGYKNLLKLVSAGYLEGYYLKPRIDKEILKQYSQGLIAILNNYQSEVGYYLTSPQQDKALSCLEEYLGIFGPSHLFLGVQDHQVPEEKIVNQAFLQFHQQKNIPLVAINDVHYLNQEDWQAHEVLLCIDGGYQLEDSERIRFPSHEYYLKSTEEMVALLDKYPGAIDNTVEIAQRCQVEIEFGKLYWPKCPIPKDFPDDDAYLAHLAWEGLKTRYTEITPEIRERCQFELDTMKKMGVAGYMLIVQDFINASRQMGIPVGPGRGSAVGSLVSYCIGITDVDPLRFNLLFERFLNPERVSMPDIDTDFSDLDRARVIKYVVNKYGSDSVAQIVTYGRMKAKMVLRDVGRVLGFEAQELNRLCKLFPADKPFADLKESVESSPQLATELDTSEATKRLKDIALKLEGTVRQAGMHAAAVIIAPEPVVNFAPLFKQPDSDQIMIQYDKQYSEDIGLLKMDFLGLRNLSVIQESAEQINQNNPNPIDIRNLPEKDPKTLQLLAKGQTVGVFQFESRGMQDYLRKLIPSGIEDLIAMNALYRPGPIENIPSYIARKNGNEPIHYYHPDLEPILGETYGVIVYQEQVMQIAQKLSGFTLGEADEMRRVMAKKKVDKMEQMRPKFVQGAKDRKYPAEIAEKIWDVLVPFSSYAFNKSHSAAYATIAYQTAFLKAHFPAQFLTANLNSEINDTERLVILLNDCSQLGIEILPPDINASFPRFTCVNEKSIRYGLAGIKNVGLSLAEKLVSERKNKGVFASLLDLCLRLNSHDLNRRALESLIYAGAMDTLKGSRAQQFAAVENILLVSGKEQKTRELGQTSLFSMDSPAEQEHEYKDLIPNVDPWPYGEMLHKEKEVLGLYLSGHPLESFRLELEAFPSCGLSKDELSEYKPDTDVIIGGTLTRIKTRISQRDKRAFAFGEVEDFLGKIEVVFWSDTYEKVSENLNPDTMILVKGKLKKETDQKVEYKIIAENVILLEEAKERLTRSIHVHFNTIGIQPQQIEKLIQLCKDYEGKCQLQLMVEGSHFKNAKIVSEKIFVSTENEFFQKLQKLPGVQKIKLSSKWHALS